MARKKTRPYKPRANTSFEGLVLNKKAHPIAHDNSNDTTLSHSDAEILQPANSTAGKGHKSDRKVDAIEQLGARMAILDAFMRVNPSDDKPSVMTSNEEQDHLIQSGAPPLTYSSLDQSPSDDPDIDVVDVLGQQLPLPVTATVRPSNTISNVVSSINRRDLWRKISRSFGLNVPQSVIDAFCSHWMTFLIITAILIVLITILLYITHNYTLLVAMWKRLLCILGVLPCVTTTPS